VPVTDVARVMDSLRAERAAGSQGLRYDVGRDQGRAPPCYDSTED